ncbi:hypothetical protein ACFVS2_20450 [Brevibacillus sp. NPDC058079]|uniref:hypothetical protein n=1 Tax=Brevibacillus sp. NPDC058079 TaxID=3346330 RepID=UPI0036E9C1F0
MIAEEIIQFEKTDRFKKEVWPRILHADHHVPILKEIDGELFWIATTWNGAWSAIQGKCGWYSIEKPFGSGQFYYRKTEWGFEYPRLDDGRTDWHNGKKVYREPNYGNIEVSLWSISGGEGKSDEIKDKIDRAIWDVNDKEIVNLMQAKAIS